MPEPWSASSRLARGATSARPSRAWLPSADKGRRASNRWSCVDLEPVKGRRRPVRQLGRQGTIVEPVAHVDQIELTDAKVAGKTEHSVEMHMGRVWLARQAIGDPHVDTFV